MDNKFGFMQYYKGHWSDVLIQLYNQCTIKQRALFDRMYPDGVKPKQVSHAIDQCARTICKNGTECYRCNNKIKCALKTKGGETK
jgi:hypothetical protein